MKSSFATVLATAAVVTAHGTVPYIRLDGEVASGFDLDFYYALVNGQEIPDVPGWYAENLDNGFVGPDAYQDPAINCHIASKPAPVAASVAAGGDVDFLWTEWPASHFGPVFTYAAKCPGNDCSTVDKTALEWVKIDEGGVNTATQQWAAEDLIANNNTWTTTIPANLAAGQYVLRHEIIAMHGASGLNGAQNYPQCFNVEVTGSGTQQLPKGTLGTQLYTAEHPGIHFNPYQELTDYEMPGPALWTGSGSNVTLATRMHARHFQ